MSGLLAVNINDNTKAVALEQEALRWNVITEDLYKDVFANVFQKLASALSNTLGPYGASTIIEQAGRGYIITKDGWTVIKNIKFNNLIESNVLEILCRISNRMVTKVGDGSTSAIIAANEFMKLMREDEKYGNLASIFKTRRRKDLNDIFQGVVDTLCEKIEQKANVVNEKNYLNIVNDVAVVATNENREFASIITDIYKKCGMDVNIRLEISPTLGTTVRYEDGQYISRMSLLDNIYVNSQNNTCELDKPMVLLFDHTLEKKHYNLIGSIYTNFAKPENRKLLVVAPAYDQFMLEAIRGNVEENVRQYREQFHGIHVPFGVVFAKAQLLNNHYMNMYYDLASLIGCEVLTQEKTEEIRDKFEDYNRDLMSKQECEQRGEFDKADSIVPDASCLQLASLYVGRLGRAVICDKAGKESAFSGFETNKETNAVFNIRYNEAKNALNVLQEKYEKEGFINSEYFDARNRFYRLSCNSATIFVGGANELEKSNNKDAMDDAVKACSSAVRYGYNIGGNLIIVKVIDEILNGPDMLSNEYAQALTIIRETFVNVYKQVLRNKFGDQESLVESFAKQSIERGTCYNLITNQFDKSVINSSRTDIEILRGAISMISVMFTCNQYISKIVVNDEVK